MPKYKLGLWDGNIRLFNGLTRQLYTGLIPYLQEYCSKKKYYLDGLNDFLPDDYSAIEAEAYIKTLNIPKQFTPRDYQIDSLIYGIRNKRTLFLSPTASGKSLIIYLLMQYFHDQTLIIVPTINLVDQMYGDLRDYGNEIPTYCITGGTDRTNIKQKYIISTWQSIYKEPESWFKRFKLVCFDEAHLAKAVCLKSIMEKLVDCPYRFGFTGTLDGTYTNKLTLEGLFGKVREVTTITKLIKDKHISPVAISTILLSYPEEIRKLCRRIEYKQEIDFLCQYEKRNKFIVNLALSLKGNTILLFNYVDKHGKVLYNMLLQAKTKRKIFFIHGGIDKDERNEIRRIVESERDAIIVASYGTFSLGVNVRNLHNGIAASPFKSRIRNLQSIGRGLRKGTEDSNKSRFNWFDIADDLSSHKYQNHTFRHFMQRLNIYKTEQMPYKFYKVGLK